MNTAQELAETPILLVDDDAELSEMVAEYLHSRGFAVHPEGDGERGLQQALNGSFQLLILDVMLPGLEGFEVLRRLRESDSPAKNLPVLMLTAHGDEVDRILGLELGADDYLSKPFNPRELLARMRAILRRTASAKSGIGVQVSLEPKDQGERIQVGAVVLEMGAREVRLDDDVLELTASEFDLLRVLMLAAGRVVSREELARNALNRRLMPFDRSLDIHISNLRRKVGTERIKTVRGTGYIYAREAFAKNAT